MAYLEAVRAEKKTLIKFKNVLTDLAAARERKYKALSVIMPEYAFLTDREAVKPGLDGKAIAVQLIKNVVERLDDDVYLEVADLFAEHK